MHGVGTAMLSGQRARRSFSAPTRGGCGGRRHLIDDAIDISNDLDEDGLGSDSGLASSDHAAPNAAHTHAAAMFERSDPPSSHSAPHTIPRLCELDMSN